MAITFERTRFGDQKTKHDFRIVGLISLDNSYPTGGYDLSAIDPRISEFYVTPVIKFISTTGYYFGYDRATKKLKAYTLADGAEVSAMVDLSSITALEFVAKVWVE